VSVAQMHGVVTDWWAADDIPESPPMLWVDGRAPAGGLVLNAAVMESVTRRHAAEILGLDASRWSLVIRNVIAEALPAQPPPLVARRPIDVGDGLWMCANHRGTASIQAGAIASPE
jgi:hypothetical protein